MAAAKGRWGPTWPAVQNCGLRWGETPGGDSVQPPPGGLASEARNVQLPGVLRGFQPRAMAAAKGVGPRNGRQLELLPSAAKPPGRFGVVPARGLGKRSPQHRGAGRFVRFSPTDNGRAEGRWGVDTAGSWKLRPPPAKPPAAVRRSPVRGLASEARNIRLPGVLCDFHPRALAAAEGRWARHGRQLKTAAFSCETAGGGSVQPPSGGLANEARNF